MSNGEVEIISGKERPRRWGLEDKLRIVAESQEPGASVRAVAARNDVYPSLLHNWRRQVREGRLAARPPMRFVPVRMADAAQPAAPLPPLPRDPSTAETIEIVLPDGWRVRVGNAVSTTMAAAQEAFKKNVAARLTQAVPAEVAGKPLEIWFHDEARVGQKGSLTYVWARVGSRPPMVRDRHDTAYLFGAICPARGVGAAIVAPAANTECMNLHLQETSTQVTPGSLAVLICDSAGWHQTGGELELPDNIVLLPLPPYSPELNPMENVWEYLRANKLSRCVWDDYDAILRACAEAWNWLINDPARIRSIGTRDWATVNVLSGW